MSTRSFIAGIAGAAGIALAYALARSAGVAVDLAWLAGSLVTGARGAHGGLAYLLGVAMQLLAGGIAGLAYAWILALAPRVTPLAGAFLGMLHAMIAGVALAALPVIHPAVPDVIDAPGLLMLERGAPAALLFVAAHVAFGVWMSVLGVAPAGEAADASREAMVRAQREPMSA